jgi:hypothetical protein
MRAVPLLAIFVACALGDETMDLNYKNRSINVARSILV